MKLKTLIASLAVSSALWGCNSGNSQQSTTTPSPSNTAGAATHSSNLYNPSMQYAIVFGSTTTAGASAVFGVLAVGNGGLLALDAVDLVISTTAGIFFGGLATAVDGVYKAVWNIVHRHDGYQHINDISVGPQMDNALWPLMLTAGGYNTDDGNGVDLLHSFDGNSWSKFNSTTGNQEIIQTSISWDRTIQYADSHGLNLAQVKPYMVTVTKYGQVSYYDPSRGEWFLLTDGSHQGNLEHLVDGNRIGTHVTGALVFWPSSGGDPKIVVSSDNNGTSGSENGAEVYYYNGRNWSNFGVTSGHNDWGYHNTVNQMSVSWDRYGHEVTGDSVPYIVAGTNYGEVKYYDPTRNGWFDLVRDDNKGNIEKIASGRSIENNQIGAMDVDWTVSGDPQVVLGTSNSGDNGAEVYYYNGHVWTNFGIKTHAGDWGRDNAVIAMSVFWQGDSAVPQTPKIVAGTNYGEVKYYDPARNGWFDLVRDDNKGNIENIANGKSIKGNAVLALQAYWPATGDPQVVISTNNSGDNGAEVYYYDSHNWTNFGVKTHDGDWGKDNSAPVLRVYWPLNDDLTFKGNGTPYIVAATTYGEVKVFNPTIGAWRELLVGGGNNDYINAGNINGIPSLLPGHKIYTDANAELQSHGISGFFAMMQEDGNFVLYKQYADGRTESLWASDTVGHGDYMDFNGDWGILAVHDGNNGMSYQSNNKAGSDGPYSLVVQGDGNMVIYGHSGVRWSSDTMQYCSPHSGTCYTK